MTKPQQTPLSKKAIQLGIVLITASLIVACKTTSIASKPTYFSSLSNNMFSKQVTCDSDSKKRDIYASSYIGIGPCHDEISVSLFVSTPSPSSPKIALDLSAEGQAAFIEKTKDGDSIHEMLAKPIKVSSKSSNVDDSAFTQIRKLTFTVATTKMAPADRITEAHLVANLPKNWEFSGWSGFAVVNSDVTAANVVDTLTNRFKASSGLGLDKFINEIVDTSIESERTKNTQVTSNLTFDVVEFLPRLTKNTAEFILSAPFQQVNLAGSYAVNVKLTYTKRTRVNNIVLTGKGERKSLKAIQKGYIKDTDDLMTFSMPYVVRRVIGASQKTMQEDDDNAIYMLIDKSKTVSENARNSQVAKIGSAAPAGKESLGLKVGQTKVSAMYLGNELLRVRFPDDYSKTPMCAVNLNGSELNDILKWLAEKPNKRLETKDDSGNLMHRLVKADGSAVSNKELKNVRILRKYIDDVKPDAKTFCSATFTDKQNSGLIQH